MNELLTAEEAKTLAEHNSAHNEIEMRLMYIIRFIRQQAEQGRRESFVSFIESDLQKRLMKLGYVVEDGGAKGIRISWD